MKFDDLRSIGHNIADSLASGIGLLIGVYETDVFGEASRSPGGFLTVDFLAGRCEAGNPSLALASAVARYGVSLAELCKKHGASRSDFRRLTARYSSDPLDRRFTVTVEDRRGHRSVDEYVGSPGRRQKVLDALGRVRRK
jgi:hypothetical protein